MPDDRPTPGHQLSPMLNNLRFPTPLAHFEDWLKIVENMSRGLLGVVHHPDDEIRTRVLREFIDTDDTAILTAVRYRTSKQFLTAVNEVRGLPTAGTVNELLHQLVDEPRALWIDDAHLLTKEMLGVVRSLYDQAASMAPIVLSSRDYAIIDNTDDHEEGAQWYSRRMVYSPQHHRYEPTQR